MPLDEKMRELLREKPESLAVVLALEGEKQYQHREAEFVKKNCGGTVAIVLDLYTHGEDEFYMGFLEEEAVAKARRAFPDAGIYVRAIGNNAFSKAVVLPKSHEYLRDFAFCERNER